MATVTTSIGTNSSLGTATPSSCSGSGPWDVTISLSPHNVSVGDTAKITDYTQGDFYYLITAISGTTWTFKYISGGMGSTSPCTLVDMSYGQASATFQRTYSTISAWESDLDDTSYYSSSDDAVGEAYNDSVFDEYIVIDSGGTVGLSSVTLTAPSSERHDGKAGTGTRIEYTGNEGSSFRIRRSQCTVEWLELDLTSTGSSVSAGLNFGTNSTQEVYARNNIIHGLTTQSTHIHGVYVFGTGNSSNTRYFMNNIVYNMDNSSTTKEASGITVSSGNWGVYLYGNTVYYVKATGSGDQAFCFSIHDTDTFLKNNIAARPDAASASNEKCFGESGFSGSTHDYNLSTDSTATGTNSLTGEDYEDLFVSVTGGTEDLHLEEGAAAIDAGVDLGTSPTGVNIDIDGFDRDTAASWDIGADEYISSAINITPASAECVFAADLTVTIAKFVTPDAAACVLAASIDNVGKAIAPDAAACVFAADLTVTIDKVVTPDAAACVFTSSLTVTVDKVVSPDAAVADVAAVDPTVFIEKFVTPDAAACVLAAVIDNVGKAIAPDAAACVFAADLTVTIDKVVTPDAAIADLAAVDPTVSITGGGTTVSPAAAAATLAAPDPTTIVDTVLTATAAFNLAAQSPTVVVTGSTTITPSAATVLIAASLGAVNPPGLLYVSDPQINAPFVSGAQIDVPNIFKPRIER
jgi:hypothetical protein